MEWKVAANRSKRGVAERTANHRDREFGVRRWLDGYAKTYTKTGQYITLFYVPVKWLEGHYDWFPVKG